MMKNLLFSFALSMIMATAFAMAPVAISDIVVENVGCNGPATGALRVTAIGGSGTYNFSISAGPVTRPAQPNGAFTALPAGLYTIVVTDVPGSSAAQATIAVGEVQPLAISTAHTEPLDCFGAAAGVIEVTAIGGKLPLTFAITNPSTTPPLIQGRMATFTGLAAGPHTITVTSADLCPPAITTLQINQPGPLAFALPTLVQPTCNGGTDGSITLNVTGGVAPFTYTLAGKTQVDNPVFTNLAAGTYTATFNDANNCGPVTQSITLGQPTSVVITDVAVVDPLCNGAATGTITVTATAPAGTVLAYILDGGTPQSSNVFTDVAAGTHTIRVESVPFVAGFCSVRTVTVTEPDAIVISISSTPAECLTTTLGTITVSATGGVEPFTFALDGKIAPSTGSSHTFTGVSAGTHEVTVTDANDCSISVEVSVALVRGTTGNPLTDFISAKFCHNTCAA